MEFRYYRGGAPYPLWNDGINRWLTWEIPIKSTAHPDWRGTANGTPDWSRIRTVEIHADTWDFGFTLWFDRMWFDLPVIAGDFDGDLAKDATDIDLLAGANNGPYHPLLDLNNDGKVTYEVGRSGTLSSDSDVLIRSILQTEYGDLDLNGQVFLADLIEFATNYRQAGQFGWADGNIDGGPELGTPASPQVFLSDLIVLATHWRFGVSSGSGSGGALPEPGEGSAIAATLERPAEQKNKPLVPGLSAQAASIALTEAATDWQGPRSRGFVKRYRGVEFGGDDLLLLALERVESSAWQIVSRAAGSDKARKTEDGDSGSLIDESLAEALASWKGLATVVTPVAHDVPLGSRHLLSGR